jgi:hypothetical protein
LALAAALAASFLHVQAAAEDGSVEYKVKASYLYKFGAFVDWPNDVFQSQDAPIHVCIAGTDPFDGIIEEVVAGQHIGGHPISVEHLKTVGPGSDCHILYAGGSDDQSVASELAVVADHRVLTVTDSSVTGGIIQFVTAGNHVRFNIDEQAAARSGLTISSKLLNLANVVRPRS